MDIVNAAMIPNTELQTVETVEDDPIWMLITRVSEPPSQKKEGIVFSCCILWM
jgi:hypothetical protein